MPKKKSKLASHDDHRGYNGIGGWWISFKEAKEKCCGKEEWWKHQGYNGFEIAPAHYSLNPADKPVWLFENGDMYLGQWKYSIHHHGWPVEHGLGVTYNNYPNKCKGLVCIGEWENGQIHGMAKSFWLESSPSWKKNEFPASPIRQKAGNKTISRPFIYIGPYNMSHRSGPGAIVTLKDGTQHIGPWQEHAPVGDWWTEHRLSIASCLSATTNNNNNNNNSQGYSTYVARRPRSSNVQADSGSDSDSDPEGKVCKSKRHKYDTYVSSEASIVSNRKRPPADGKRGLARSDGWWISLKESQERCCGQEAWWRLQVQDKNAGAREDDYAQNGPMNENKPVWLFTDGDMHLGQWKYSRDVGCYVEHGRGSRVQYYHGSGSVYIGDWENGLPHRKHRLASSPMWKVDLLQGSPVVIPRGDDGKKNVARPFNYSGPLVKGNKHGPEGVVVVLKNKSLTEGGGSGPWKDDQPVGDWWKDHSYECRRRLASKIFDSAEQQDSKEEESPEGQQQDRHHPGRSKRSAPISPVILEDDGRKRAARPSVMTSIHQDEGFESATTMNRSLDRSCASRARNAEIEDIGASQNIDAGGPAQINTSGVEDKDEDNVLEIAVWLMNDVIGFGYNNTDEAKSYARQIIAFGAHSVQMIVACLAPSDVEGFEWMKPLHQRRLTEKLPGH